MAKEGYKFKRGSTEVEIIKAFTVATTAGTELTHSLGVIPTAVQVIPTSAYHVFFVSATASKVTIGSANSAATCEVIVEYAAASDAIAEA